MQRKKIIIINVYKEFKTNYKLTNGLPFDILLNLSHQ